MSEEQKHFLTRQRWEVLMALKKNPHLMKREFLAKEIIINGRSGKLWAASGTTIESLKRCGWVEHVTLGASWGNDTPFRMGRMPSAWRITEAGRKAVEACPDQFPGEPRYGEGNG